MITLSDYVLINLVTVLQKSPYLINQPLFFEYLFNSLNQ